MSHILVVEDNLEMQNSIMRGLLRAGYQVTTLSDGLEARLFDLTNIDLILIDWMLPKFDGPSLIKYWKKLDIIKPVILLTARGSSEDIVEGLNIGADDYITKTFHWPELLARIEKQLNRNINKISQIEHLFFDRLNQAFFYKQQLVNLTKTEYNILKHFFNQSNQLITTEKLQYAIWPNQQINSNVVARHIKSIRQKLNYDPIITIKNMGYRLKSS